MYTRALIVLLTMTACSDKFDENTSGLVDSDTDTPIDTDTDTIDENTVDDDGDGFTEDQGDCDDTNSAIYPAADEYCNGDDDDCDGEIDEAEDLADGQGETRNEDADGDGYGNPYVTGTACDLSEGYVNNDEDCDDTEASANPDGVELNWNGIDEDCDGEDFDLEGCLDRAVTATSAEMVGGSPWALEDFRGEYDLDIAIAGFKYTLSGAGFGEVNDQLADITEQSSEILSTGGGAYSVEFETSIAYNSADEPFEVTVGIEESYWDFGVLGYTVGSVITSAIELVTDVPKDFDGTFTCYGYVDAIDADFDGSVTLFVSESAQTVDANIALESNVTDLTDGDAVLTDSKGGQCANDIIDTIAGYIGIGSTYKFLNENLEEVGTELLDSYNTRLTANIESECSGG